jgi:hypothetical protein
MHRYLQREYGDIGQFIETNVLHERTLPTLNEIKAVYTTLNNESM